MNRFLIQGNNFQELFPPAVLFITIWCLVWVSLQKMNLFPPRISLVLSVCVTMLSMLGITEQHLDWIFEHYALMAITILFGLATAIRLFWKKAFLKNKQR